MPTVDDYLALIPAFNAAQPKLRATITAYIEPMVAAQEFMAGFPAVFDLDTAIGVQLDAVGKWVGRSRYVTVPLPNVFFSFDIEGLGWDEGVWQGPYDPSEGLTRLDDDLYRLLLRAKIAANHWDGTVTGARLALRKMFTELLELGAQPILAEDGSPILAEDGTPILADPVLFQGFYVEDTGRMAVIFGLAGKLPQSIFLSLWAGGYIPVKPAGVEAVYLFTSVDSTPVFGFDVSNGYIGGWDEGSWGVSRLDLVEF